MSPLPQRIQTDLTVALHEFLQTPHERVEFTDAEFIGSLSPTKEYEPEKVSAWLKAHIHLGCLPGWKRMNPLPGVMYQRDSLTGTYAPVEGVSAVYAREDAILPA